MLLLLLLLLPVIPPRLMLLLLPSMYSLFSELLLLVAIGRVSLYLGSMWICCAPYLLWCCNSGQ